MGTELRDGQGRPGPHLTRPFCCPPQLAQPPASCCPPAPAPPPGPLGQLLKQAAHLGSPPAHPMSPPALGPPPLSLSCPVHRHQGVEKPRPEGRGRGSQGRFCDGQVQPRCSPQAPHGGWDYHPPTLPPHPANRHAIYLSGKAWPQALAPRPCPHPLPGRPGPGLVLSPTARDKVSASLGPEATAT